MNSASGTGSTAPTQQSEVGWSPMIFIALGIAMVIMDTTIVNVSLPTIIADLGISSIDAEWVQSIYALMFAALLIIFGRLGDRFGRKRLFLLGAVVFAAASVLAASSSTGELLIAARALQGLGGAMMSPTSLSIVNATYLGSRRVIAFAIYGSVIGGMAAIGPLLGGYLTETFSWHWSFLINVPVALIIVIGGIALIPESRDDDATPGADLIGSVLSAVGIGALVFGLIEGRSFGWWTAKADRDLLGVTWTQGGVSPVALALTLSLVALTALWVVELRRRAAGHTVLIDVTLFRIGSFGWGSLAALILSLGEFGILFSLPLFLQSTLGYTALSAGALLASLAVGSFIAGPTTQQLAHHLSPRGVARLGMGLEVVGILGLGLVLSTSVSAWEMAIWLGVYGLGVGYASAQLTGVILADVPRRQSGQASGTSSTARQLGSAMGTAVLGTILFIGLANDTEARVGALDGVSAQRAQEVARAVEDSAGTAIPGIAAQPGGVPIADAASEAFADSIKRTAYFAAGFVSLGLLATMLLPKARREEDDEAPTPDEEPAEAAA